MLAQKSELNHMRPGAFARIGLCFLSLLAGIAVLALGMPVYGYGLQMWRRHVYGPQSYPATLDADSYLPGLELYVIVALCGWVLTGPLTAVLLRTHGVVRLKPVAGALLGSSLGCATILLLLTANKVATHEPLSHYTSRAVIDMMVLPVIVGAPTGFVYFRLVQRFVRPQKLVG